MIWNKVTGCSMMFDAALARRYPRIPAGFDFHDHRYAVVASCLGRIVAVHQVLGAYRQHEHNVLGADHFTWSVDPLAMARPLQEFRANTDRWNKVVQRYEDAVREGLDVPRSVQRLLFGRDLGLRLAIRGVLLFISDPRLAQYAFEMPSGSSRPRRASSGTAFAARGSIVT